MFYWEDYLAAYMFVALALLLFSGIPVAFVLGGVALGFGFLGASVGMFSVIEFFNILPRIWGGAAENLVLVAVPCFIFMGTMLERSGVAEDLLNIMQLLLRRVPGGLAMAVIGMGTIMAATTGIIGASVVMMSMLALPTMLKARYSTELACGTIASSATLGILIPPSIMLVIMADLMAISVGNLFLGAILPGLLLSSLYCLYVFVVTKLRPELAPQMPEEMAASGVELARLLAKGFIPPVILIAMVLGSIFAGLATPTEASGVGAFGSILLAGFNRRLNMEVLRDVSHRTALTTGMVFFIVIGATAFSYVFRSLGGEGIIVGGIEHLNLGSWGLLVLLMTIVFFLGFFFDWIEITLIVLPVFGPIVAGMDFGAHVPKVDLTYWFALLLSVNLQTSFLTPPFGFALFYLKGVAPPEVKIQHIYKGIIPFVTLQLIGLIAVIGYPEIALWLPRYMFD
jgi:tripartite ATP-independent transporter DctM subunit